MDTEFDRVNQELIDAREGFHKAREMASSALQLMRDLNDPLNPDGIVATKASKQSLEQAWERYQTAINSYGKYRARS
jgi:hypothetical protein